MTLPRLPAAPVISTVLPMAERVAIAVSEEWFDLESAVRAVLK